MLIENDLVVCLWIDQLWKIDLQKWPITDFMSFVVTTILQEEFFYAEEFQED